MKNTITQAEWIAGQPSLQLQKLVQQLRRAANFRGEHKVGTKTEDATPTLLWEEQMTQATMWLIEATVFAYAEDHNIAFYERSQRYRCDALGAVTLVRSTTPIADDEDVAAWDIAFSFTADGIVQLHVTGDARAVTWLALIKVFEL